MKHPQQQASQIVLVDDDPAVLASLKFALELEGFCVLAYSNPAELLGDTAVSNPGCFVIDYHLPSMSGLDLLRILRVRNEHVPAVLVTTNPSARLRDRAAAAGITIVEKPFLGDGLMEAIRSSVSRGSSAH